jgi:hypothetical protein
VSIDATDERRSTCGCSMHHPPRQVSLAHQAHLPA